MNQFTTTIPAGAAVIMATPGKVLSVKSCSLPLSVALDFGQPLTIQAGAVVTGPFNSLNFNNTNSAAVTITYFAGDTAVNYAPGDNSQSNASTYALGNLGIANGAGAAGGLPACDANGYLQITNAMALTVGSTNNGHRRQIISFSVSAASPAPLNLLDANGCAVMTIAAGQQILLVTDATFVLSGAGGTAAVTVGQIFLLS